MTEPQIFYPPAYCDARGPDEMNAYWHLCQQWAQRFCQAERPVVEDELPLTLRRQAE